MRRASTTPWPSRTGGDLLDWAAWEPTYERILADLSLTRADDEAARDLLLQLLPRDRLTMSAELDDLFRHRVAVIVGAGPRVLELGGAALAADDEVLVAAGSATAPLLDAGGEPRVVVTDLDGDVGAQVEANRRGAVAVLHAHGDNRDALHRWVPSFPGPVLGTTQAEPRPPVVNRGGFTDGDRAAFLAAHHGARAVRLVAFDLEHPGPTSSPGKLAKLRWAARLLDEVPVPVTRG